MTEGEKMHQMMKKKKKVFKYLLRKYLWYGNIQKKWQVPCMLVANKNSDSEERSSIVWNIQHPQLSKLALWHNKTFFFFLSP